MCFVGVALEEALKEGTEIFQGVHFQNLVFSACCSRIAYPSFFQFCGGMCLFNNVHVHECK